MGNHGKMALNKTVGRRGEEENLVVQKDMENISLTTKKGKRDSKKAKDWGNHCGREGRKTCRGKGWAMEDLIAVCEKRREGEDLYEE